MKKLPLREDTELTLEGTPRKRQYRRSAQQRAAKAARDAVKEKQKELDKLTRKVDSKKSLLKKTQNKSKVIEKAIKGEAAVIEEEVSRRSTLRDYVADQDVAFKPNDGPQRDFLAASEEEVLYGGAAGGGKSYGLLANALEYIHRPACRVLILRKTIDELEELIWKSKELYIKAFPKAEYKKSDRTWEFPSGGTITFDYLDKDEDVTRYQGQSFTLICFDELTHWHTPYAWDYLRSRLRTTDPEIKVYMRATTNPGGRGSDWVKKMFVEPAPPGEAFWARDQESGKILRYPPNHPLKANRPLFRRRFIPARLQDNPYLWKDGEYEKQLLALPEVERKRLLEGDWDVTEGAAFPEFSKYEHTYDQDVYFEKYGGLVPNSWIRFRSMDYGYSSPSCVLWGAMDRFTNTLVIYRELYIKQKTPDEIGAMIVRMEANDPTPTDAVLDESCFNRKGTISEGEQLNKHGLRFRASDRDRISGKLQIHKRLKKDEVTGKPKLIILKGCRNLIRELGNIPLSKTDSEDVDTKASDHAYDALRYMCMLRKVDTPMPMDRIRMLQSRYQEMNRRTVFDPVFNY